MRVECIGSTDINDRSCVVKFYTDAECVEIPLQDVDHYHALMRVIKHYATEERNGAINSINTRVQSLIGSYIF